MYDALFPDETERALEFRARNPEPPKAPRASIWGQTAELLSAPVKGVGQAGMQTARVANIVVPPVVGNPLAMDAAEQEALLSENNITTRSQDQALRRGVEALRPDPVTSTAASRFIQEGTRVVSKAVGYGIVGGPLAAVAGTGVDEGVTTAQELQDRGVDPITAAQVGVVRGATTAAGVALPVVGKTVLQTIGLVTVGGPGLFMAEQAATREILERANYNEIAREYDPFDPAGLALSVAIPGAVGVVVHRARVRAGQTEKQARALDEVAQDPAMVDAALVAHRTQTVNERALGDISRPDVAASHTRAIDEAARALDEGAPVHVGDVVVEPAVAGRMLAEVDSRLTAARAEIDATPELQVQRAMPIEEPRVTAVTTPVQPEVPQSFGSALVGRIRDAVAEIVRPEAPRIEATPQPPHPRSPEVQRAEAVASRRPDLPVRLDDNGSAPMRADDVMHQARHDAQRESAEARKALEAAVTCFLEVGA